MMSTPPRVPSFLHVVCNAFRGCSSPASELRIHLVSSHRHAGMDVDTHVGEGRFELWVSQVQGLQDLAADRQEGLLRPGAEPVDGAAVDEGGEHAAAGPEGAPHGAHGQHAVQVVPHTIDEGRPARFLHVCSTLAVTCYGSVFEQHKPWSHISLRCFISE